MNATYTSAGKLLYSIFQTKLDLVLRNILRKKCRLLLGGTWRPRNHVVR